MAGSWIAFDHRMLHRRPLGKPHSKQCPSLCKTAALGYLSWISQHIAARRKSYHGCRWMIPFPCNSKVVFGGSTLRLTRFLAKKLWWWRNCSSWRTQKILLTSWRRLRRSQGGPLLQRIPKAPRIPKASRPQGPHRPRCITRFGILASVLIIPWNFDQQFQMLCVLREFWCWPSRSIKWALELTFSSWSTSDCLKLKTLKAYEIWKQCKRPKESKDHSGSLWNQLKTWAGAGTSRWSARSKFQCQLGPSIPRSGLDETWWNSRNREIVEMLVRIGTTLTYFDYVWVTVPRCFSLRHFPAGHQWGRWFFGDHHHRGSCSSQMQGLDVFR